MIRHVLQGNPPIDVTVRKSAQARRLSLRISRTDGRVTLTMPKGVPDRTGIEFLDSREGWLRRHLDGLPGEVRAGIGQLIPFQGQDIPVIGRAVRRVVLTDEGLVVPEDPARAGARVLAFLKTNARDQLAAASDRYATALGRSYRNLTLRDTRSRWGSCTSDGDLMYSWRLIMAPPAVLNYVAAHEVAHLVEMNHSDAFWAVVNRLFPDHVACRRWLKKNGEALHRVRFTD